MRVYMFAAALYCEPCGEAIKARTPKPAHVDESNEHTFDSDEWPKGPYGDGGGEADCPQHCDACRVFLENPLTAEGYRWLRGELDCESDLEPGDSEYTLAARIAAKLRETPNGATLAQWAEFYPEALAAENGGPCAPEHDGQPDELQEWADFDPDC
jgi:hypothetical protein